MGQPSVEELLNMEGGINADDLVIEENSVKAMLGTTLPQPSAIPAPVAAPIQTPSYQPQSTSSLADFFNDDEDLETGKRINNGQGRYPDMNRNQQPSLQEEHYDQDETILDRFQRFVQNEKRMDPKFKIQQVLAVIQYLAEQEKLQRKFSNVFNK